MSETINVATAFSQFPGTRFRRHGKCSAEEFRDDYLAKWLKQHDKLTLDFSGIFAISPSFIDEAFGGLLTRHGYEEAELLERLAIVGDKEVVEMVFETIHEIESHMKDVRK